MARLFFNTGCCVKPINEDTSGILNSGSIKAGDSVLVGPDSNGGWMVSAVKSIHRKR